MTEDQIIEMFHLMWDSVPGLVRLIRKNRTVVAVNRAGMLLGYPAGIPCTAFTPPEAHRHCKANLALSTGEAQIFCGNPHAINYWIPLTDDLYVHYTMQQTNGVWDFKNTSFPGLNAK